MSACSNKIEGTSECEKFQVPPAHITVPNWWLPAEERLQSRLLSLSHSDKNINRGCLDHVLCQ